MTSFLSGAAAAAILSIVTYVAMTMLYVSTEVRYAGENLHLEEQLIESSVADQ